MSLRVLAFGALTSSSDTGTSKYAGLWGRRMVGIDVRFIPNVIV